MRSPMHTTSVRNRLQEKGFDNPSIKPIMIGLASSIFDPILLERNPSNRPSVTVKIDRHDFTALRVDLESSGIDHARDFYVEGLYKNRRVRAYFIGMSSKNGRLTQVFIERTE